jgi:hypothetical protein
MLPLCPHYAFRSSHVVLVLGPDEVLRRASALDPGHQTQQRIVFRTIQSWIQRVALPNPPSSWPMGAMMHPWDIEKTLESVHFFQASVQSLLDGGEVPRAQGRSDSLVVPAMARYDLASSLIISGQIGPSGVHLVRVNG